MDQYDMHTEGHTELEALLLGEIADSLVAVLEILDGSQIVWIRYHTKGPGFHNIEGLETRGVALQLLWQLGL